MSLYLNGILSAMKEVDETYLKIFAYEYKNVNSSEIQLTNSLGIQLRPNIFSTSAKVHRENYKQQTALNND